MPDLFTNPHADLTPQQLSDLYTALEAEDLAAATREIVMADAALWYATTLRWPIFPLREGEKVPLKGSRGFKDATCDVDLIRRWWTAHPEANIAVPTGPRDQGGCGLDVIDIDGPVGNLSYADMRHAHCPPDCCAETFCPAMGDIPPVQAIAHTPHGRHMWITASGDGNTTSLAPGIDYRGQGGYVVVPPSTIDGKRYQWLERPT